MGDKMNNIYDIDLDIDVVNQFIYSKVKFKYYCNLSKIKELNFYLHKNMEIEKIISDKKMTYEVSKEISKDCPFILEGRLIKISFEDLIYENNIINISFKYKGHIDFVTEDKVNRITEKWIELNLYSAWFPLEKSFCSSIFKTTVNINNEYKIINSKVIENKKVINKTIPMVDCAILASNGFNEIEVYLEDIKLKVYYIEDENEVLAKRIRKYVIDIFNFYKSFGKTMNEEVSIVIAPRKYGGGYCRPGLIVITKEDDRSEEDYFKFIAHELAHLWWNNADPTTWEDWLNESFAEFSALIALRDNFGEKEFNNKIKEFEESIKGLPPIKFLNRSDEKAFLVLYRKGPFILYRLEKEIGREKFLDLLKLIHKKNINNTEDLLEEIVNIISLEIKNKFNEFLTK